MHSPSYWKGTKTVNTPVFISPEQSPFDSIRQVRPDGTEFWSARDLMSVMGYSKWQAFEVPVTRAAKSAENQGLDVQVNFTGSRKFSGTKPAEDFELSRFAAYLVAMNGDPNKPEVASAQAYFAIQTRVAETRPAFDPAALSRSDILKMALAAEEEKSVLEAALESATPAIEYHEKHIAEDDDVVVMRVWGTQHGMSAQKAYALLIEKGFVYKTSLGHRWSESKGRKVEEFEYRPRAGKVTSDWFVLRPQHNAPRHHNGQVRQTLYVKQFFADQLAAKCGINSQIELDAA